MMIHEIKANLLNTISPFWKKLKDDEYGGFYGFMSHDLQLDQKADKGVILNSRILWYFANQYLILKDKEDLVYARHAYTFFKEKCLDKEYGGVYWMLTYDGKPSENMKHTYNQAFAIYALSSYYDATGDKEAIETAKDLFRCIETVCRDEYGYLEAFDREWKPISNEKLSDNKHLGQKGVVAEKTMNALLHILEAYTELYRVSKDKVVGSKLKDLLVLFKEQVYNPKSRTLGVFFDKNMYTICDMHSYGHDIEAAWLLDRGAEVLGDVQLIADTKKYTIEIAYKVKEVAFEKGALNNERFEDFIDQTRIWWVQAEGIVGFINAYEKNGDKTFLEIAHKLWEYTKTYIVDKRPNAEWYWNVAEDGSPILESPIVEPWKCPYHNGRMCLEVIRRNINV